jgi:hypothetical protein
MFSVLVVMKGFDARDGYRFGGRLEHHPERIDLEGNADAAGATLMYSLLQQQSPNLFLDPGAGSCFRSTANY